MRFIAIVLRYYVKYALRISLDAYLTNISKNTAIPPTPYA